MVAVVVVVVVVVDIVLFEGALIAKVIEDQVLDNVKHPTGSIGSRSRSSNSSSSSSASRRHGLNQRRGHSKSNRGSGTSLCEVLD